MQHLPWKCSARQALTIGSCKTQIGTVVAWQIHAQKSQFGICNQLQFHHMGAAFSLGSTDLLLQYCQLEHLALVQADGNCVLPSNTDHLLDLGY